jgi:hypothetical protein
MCQRNVASNDLTVASCEKAICAPVKDARLQNQVLVSVPHFVPRQAQPDHRRRVQQKGTVDHTSVYVREVVKRALELSATAVVLVHNHPSGDPTPRAPISR